MPVAFRAFHWHPVLRTKKMAFMALLSSTRFLWHPRGWCVTCLGRSGLISFQRASGRSVAMLVMHFGHRDPEMHSHDATSYYAAIRPASAALHHYAVRHSSHNDFTPGCVACFARTTPGYRGLLDPAFGSPVSSPEELYVAEGPSMDQRPNLVGVG